MYIPEGYGTVFPYVIVERAGAFLAFLQQTFDAVELGRTETPDGRIANARIRIGTTSFMVSEAEGGMMKAMPAAYYVYVADVDRTLARAVANGATKMFDAMDMPYGDRQAGVTDPTGNVWWISNRIDARPYDE